MFGKREMTGDTSALYILFGQNLYRCWLGGMVVG